jgi:hypothetical protein
MSTNSNIHNQSVPQDKLEEALQKIDEAVEILRLYLHSLTAEDRQTILKMGDKSLAFVEKTSELAASNPQFCPSYFNLAELNIDIADAVGLRTLSNRLQQFSRSVDDTMMLAGNEAFVQALTFYNAVKQAARDNVPGAQPLFDELKKRFAIGRPKKTKDDE